MATAFVELASYAPSLRRVLAIYDAIVASISISLNTEEPTPPLLDVPDLAPNHDRLGKNCGGEWQRFCVRLLPVQYQGSSLHGAAVFELKMHPTHLILDTLREVPERDWMRRRSNGPEALKLVCNHAAKGFRFCHCLVSLSFEFLAHLRLLFRSFLCRNTLFLQTRLFPFVPRFRVLSRSFFHFLLSGSIILQLDHNIRVSLLCNLNRLGFTSEAVV
mmetsp:Transcript_35568/g.57147  ORF Transcript_35568/g.57147 Transcript_35568/m.57147 type:complete len:217 (-) Transcript_35568:650-1300(-)